MSDRTRLTVSYAERDRAAFETEFGVCDEEDISDAGVVEATYDGVNYGGYNELVALAARGIPFFGHYDAGCEYPSAYVTGYRRKYDEAVGGIGVWTLCLDFDLDTGKVSGLADARKFRRHWRGAIAAVTRRVEKHKGKVATCSGMSRRN